MHPFAVVFDTAPGVELVGANADMVDPTIPGDLLEAVDIAGIGAVCAVGAVLGTAAMIITAPIRALAGPPLYYGCYYGQPYYPPPAYYPPGYYAPPYNYGPH